MGSFSRSYLFNLTFATSTTWFISQCSEARGMQEMWRKMRPEILKKLKESAIVQSTESSNRIEGVEVEKDRLLPLVLGKSKPRNRPEEEIAGYKNALSYIHQKYREIKINPTTIKKLHRMAQGGMVSDAGIWKKKDNEIIEISPQGDRFIRFKPSTAKQTPKAIEQLCLAYQDVTQNSQLPELVAVANFIFDFLCIHPFRDGNGRVSRLLTLLLLYQNGYEVGRFISLEKAIENTKDDYYRVLGESSAQWHQGKHDLLPWWNYFLGIIKNSYQELRDRVDLSKSSEDMSSLIRQSILAFDTPFSISDIQRIHPTLGRDLIKKVLQKLKEEKLITSSGRGRSAKWALS